MAPRARAARLGDDPEQSRRRLARLGERESGTARLEEAVAAYRAALQEWTRERVPLDWAMTQNNLGIALRIWASGRRAASGWRRRWRPMSGAAGTDPRARAARLGRAQNNLGNALWTLGERESGTARLEEAVAAYRAALQEWTRERVPLDWATTQNNLGNALSDAGRAGERDGAAGGGGRGLSRRAARNGPASACRSTGRRRRTTSAMRSRRWASGRAGRRGWRRRSTAYRAALEECTRERVPLDWARTQNNLGTALWQLGERESGTARLEEAVAAYRAALRGMDPRARAARTGRGPRTTSAMRSQTLGERESGTARLEEAVAAYRAALQEWTRERVPLDWAMTQNNLGNALQTLGERESGTARLEEAVAAYRARWRNGPASACRSTGR